MVVHVVSTSSPAGAWELGPSPTICAVMSSMERWMATSTCPPHLVPLSYDHPPTLPQMSLPSRPQRPRPQVVEHQICSNQDAAIVHLSLPCSCRPLALLRLLLNQFP
ncbi:hypothetical protein HAX54_012858 [Datura stramonium]|uniref:Uncharacterized protein n=1 Tax=Datura stramonium TaxID=4076 RepID=A0ABS8TKG8_DATST|nr:hypothetical protein [Datura stramonium]